MLSDVWTLESESLIGFCEVDLNWTPRWQYKWCASIGKGPRAYSIAFLVKAITSNTIANWYASIQKSPSPTHGWMEMTPRIAVKSANQ